MNRLSTQKRAEIIRCLVEGNSINATCRMTGAAKMTVLKLLRDLSDATRTYQDEHIRFLDTRRIQADEIWSFVYARLVGERSMEAARDFMADVASRVVLRPQITTDANVSYREAIDAAFGSEVDYAQLLKDYGPMASEDASPTARRYSPNVVTSIEKRVISGNPDPDHISTSHVERQNLTMRMGMRRFIRLTNAFSKKVENLGHAVSIHFMYYNFARPHKSLGKNVTPAMAAGIADHVWTCQEIAALLD